MNLSRADCGRSVSLPLPCRLCGSHDHTRALDVGTGSDQVAFRGRLALVPVAWMHAFIDVPSQHGETARTFWSAVSGWQTSDAWEGHPEFVSLLPADGAPYLHVQTIGGPPRVHLDIVGDIEQETARLEELGATRGQRGDAWQVMSSPGGLPFCVCDEPWPHRRPTATGWPVGHRSRLVQLCVDAPRECHDAELAFWRAATGWDEEPVDSPEFHRLVHRETSPLQLLIQQLGDDDQGVEVRAHLDLGADDVAAEVRRVEALGARVSWTGKGFVALQDPLGMPFCVTGNDPDR
jgi:hypothetical protein